MKRFLLFAGGFYYAAGGWRDFVESFDSLIDALGEISERSDDWSHVVDTETMSVVWQTAFDEDED